MAEKQAGAQGAETGGAPSPRVRWDESNVEVRYANVANVGSTREEVVVSFGVHHGWQGGQEEIVVQVSNRMILNPFAAKRLWTMLGGVLQQYETRFGQLDSAAQSSPADTRG